MKKKHYVILSACLLIIVVFVVSKISKPEINVSTSEAAAKTILTKNDITYLGAFNVDVGNNFPQGIAVRYVNGVRQILVLDLDDHLYGFSNPSFSLSAPYPNAAPYTDYGILGSSAKLITEPTPNYLFSGLYWDEISGRLFWNYMNDYGFGRPDYSFGASTLNDANHTVTDSGCWGFNQNYRYANNGTLPIPSWFTSQYLSSGQRLAAGFGGYQSSNGGAASFGPSLTAFTPDLGTNNCPDQINFLPGKLMMVFPKDMTHARTNLTSYFDWISYNDPSWGSDNPVGNTGYWTGMSLMRGMLWIDTPNKTGILAFAALGDGNYSGTITASTQNTMTLNTITMGDGTSIAPGDVLNVQQDPVIQTNCVGTESVKVIAVNGNTVTFVVNGKSTNNNPPYVGGRVIGGVYYCLAILEASRIRERVSIYDPADLGAVILGQKPVNSPSPKEEWPLKDLTPELLDPNSNAHPPGTGMRSVTFDPVTNQIFVMFAHQNGLHPYTSSRVYVYKVNDTNAPPVATLSFTATPSAITTGSSSTLAWSATNVTSCNATGAWNGSKTPSANQSLSVSPTTTSTYTLDCSGSNGSISRSVTITVSPIGTTVPTATISATPSSIIAGGSSILSWSSTNATGCTASGAWSGPKGISGPQTVTPGATSTYSIVCTGTGGTSPSQSATVTVTIASPPPPPPTPGTLSITSPSAGTSVGGTFSISVAGIPVGSSSVVVELRNQTGGAVNSWSSAVSSGATTATVTAFANLQANAVYNLEALSGSQISLPISVTLTGGVGPIPAPVPLAGDIDGNGQVNSLDWSIMSTRWFTADAAADLNHDGIVNSIDFSILNNNWFRTVP